MGYSWKIQKAAVEQEIQFPSEEVYVKYIAGFIRREEPFEIVDEKENEDGTYTVIMRKRYNNNAFFRKEKISKEDFIKFIRNLYIKETEDFLEQVNANPDLKDVQVPEDMFDKIMARIRENEIKGNA